jgi:hypothetical protein
LLIGVAGATQQQPDRVLNGEQVDRDRVGDPLPGRVSRGHEHMAPTRARQVLGDRGRVGGVVEDHQPPRPPSKRIARPGGQLSRRPFRRQAQRHREVSECGEHAELSF